MLLKALAQIMKKKKKGKGISLTDTSSGDDMTMGLAIDEYSISNCSNTIH